MSNKIRAAVIGTGWPSLQHINSYKKLKNVELVAICDIDQEKCAQVADEYNISGRYSDFNALLAREKPHVVSICTPNFLHARMSIAAMENGAHVLCEKPMASTVADAISMLNVQRKTGKVLMIAHQKRFSLQAQYLKNMITSGELGEIYHVRAWWVRRQGIPGMGGWFTQKEKSGGGSLIDIGVHILDLALWYLGHPEPLNVSSSWGSRFGAYGRGASGYAAVTEFAKQKFNVDDYVFAHVNYPKGVSLQIQCSWAGFIKQEEMNIEIWGDRGGARLYPLEIYTEKNDAQVNVTPIVSEVNAFDEEMRLFFNAVESGAPSPYDPLEGVKVMELIDKIYSNGSPSDKKQVPVNDDTKEFTVA